MEISKTANKEGKWTSDLEGAIKMLEDGGSPAAIVDVAIDLDGDLGIRPACYVIDPFGQQKSGLYYFEPDRDNMLLNHLIPAEDGVFAIRLQGISREEGDMLCDHYDSLPEGSVKRWGEYEWQK